MMRVRRVCVLLTALVLCCGSSSGSSDVWSALVSRAEYELESTVMLNDAARAHSDVSYKIRARLTLLPLTHSTDLSDPVLMHYRLEAPKLYLRGKHINADFMPYDSVWDSYSDTSFYTLWKGGLIEKAFFDPDDLPDVLNYKKSLVSLFQFQAEQGEFNETDVSGPCSVLYETISTQVFRKIKRQCEYESSGVVRSARRICRVTLEGGEVSALHSEELVWVGSSRGVKARAWHSLRRAGTPLPSPGTPATPAALEDALRQLPAALTPLPLTLSAPLDEQDDQQDLSAVLEEHGAALDEGEAGAGGALTHARALLALLPAAQRADTAALQAVLDAAPASRLPALARLLGLAATRAAHAAADHLLHLGAAEPLLHFALQYLAGIALAPAPHSDTLRAVLRLAARAKHPALQHAALLSAAAAAARLPPDHALAAEVRDALTKTLSRCKDAECRAGCLAALHNLRRADTADLLLHHAERGELVALLALGALPPDALTFARLDRLQAVALDERLSLEVRGAALDVLAQRRADLPAALVRVMHALYTRGPHELRRVLWQRMSALAPQHAELQRLPALLEPALRGWDAAAHGGTSSVLVRALGWQAGGWRAQLDSLQLASAGVLRRGVVRLQALDANNNTFDALAVEVWTRGLEAFSGGNTAAEGGSEGGGEGGGEEAAGGLALTVGGARLPEVSLFRGQAELLAHVWAGTASTPTAVLRAALPLVSRGALLPLSVGCVVRVSERGAAALALDAAAQVSLWWRSARAELQLRAGAAHELSAALHTAWARLSARAASGLEPRLSITADLDFYSSVALCVRVRTEEHVVQRGVRLQSAGGARHLRVRRARSERWPAAGVTLALGSPNDHTCRTLRAADADNDNDIDS